MITRIKRIWNRLLCIFAPLPSIAASLAAIAEEMKIARELKEMELSYHNPPIYRITEQPSPGDTEVFYGTDGGKGERNALTRAYYEEDDEDEDDD
jgi:hypothetical protein